MELDYLAKVKSQTCNTEGRAAQVAGKLSAKEIKTF